MGKVGKTRLKSFIKIDRFFKPCWTVKSVLYRDKIIPLESLPSLRCRVRSAHTATQTPRKKMANAIILPLPTRCDKQIFLFLCSYEKNHTIKSQNEKTERKFETY